MRVPMLDIPVMHAPFRDDLVAALTEVLDSGSYINGPFVEQFEQQLANYCGSRFAVGVTSGSDALIIALMALGVGPGDEIVTTPFTFFATAGAIARVGAKPVFVDIEPDTFNIDAGQIEAAITPRTKGILPVSLFGQTCDLTQIAKIAERHGVWVIEDAAQSIGARHLGRMSGTFPLAGTYSFFPAKNLGGIGDGGAVLTDDEGFADQLKVMRNHGGQDRYYYERVGGNFRLDAIQAAILSVKLPHLKAWEERRRANALQYHTALDGHPDVVCPREAPGRYHVYNQYVLRVKNGQRAAYERQLKEQGIAFAIYYPLCLHQQQCFAYLGHQSGAFPQAELAATEVLAIPVLTDRADWVIAALKGV